MASGSTPRPRPCPPRSPARRPLPTTPNKWPCLHGSWDRTPTSLGTHRNTVRRRLTRIAALLDADLDAPDIGMELWFTLRSPDRDPPPA
ncbi:helix-turn-helix domain-containing protein [Streptomyces sp. GS7]|uniref:helix-turn-helix domain-containing protein n=1 Tax=Streptomyces sp. GS7 TaxID=2692234 RepID=UPI003FA76963